MGNFSLQRFLIMSKNFVIKTKTNCNRKEMQFMRNWRAKFESRLGLLYSNFSLGLNRNRINSLDCGRSDLFAISISRTYPTNRKLRVLHFSTLRTASCRAPLSCTTWEVAGVARSTLSQGLWAWAIYRNCIWKSHNC